MTTVLRKAAQLRCARAGVSSAVEIGTLVFALINLILAVLPTLYTLTTLIYIWTSPAPEIHWHWPLFGYYSPELHFVVDQVLLLFCMSLISLIFGSYLAVGVIKQKPNHIKVYLVYGVIVHVISSLAVVGFLFLSNAVNVFFCTGFILLALYAMILLMIYNTYKRFKSVNDQFDHKVLDQTPKHV